MCLYCGESIPRAMPAGARGRVPHHEASRGVKLLSRTTAVGAVAGILGGIGVAVVVTVALVIIRKPRKE
jgi:hypothetical protein